MNLNDLPQGSYTPVPPPTAPQATPQATPPANAPLNINNLPQGSYTSVQPKDPGIVQDALNFAAPILPDIASDINGTNKKTVLQQAADLGLTGLWFIPGVGDAADAAIDTARAGADVAEGAAATTDVAKSASTISKIVANPIAKGAALGYGAGALSGVAQGESIPQAIAPGAGTIAGALTGGAAAAILPKISSILSNSLSESGSLNAVTKNLEDEVSRTSPGRTLLSNLPNGGKDALDLIAQSGSLPVVEGNHFNVDDGIDNLQSRVGSLGDARATAMDQFPTTTSLDELAAEAKARIGTAADDASPAEKALAQQRAFSGEAGNMQNKIDAIVSDIKTSAGLKADDEGVMPDMQLTPSQLESFKEAQMKNSGRFKYNGSIGDENAASLLGSTAKDKIESLANDSGFSGMKEYNQYMKTHYDAQKILQRLSKQTVKGGRLGNMLMGHVLGATTAGIANASGMGFLGSIGGLLTGETGGNFISKLIGENSISNPLRDAVLARIEQEDPEIVQELKNFSGQTGSIAPVAIPKVASKTAKRTINILIKGAARAGGSL